MDGMPQVTRTAYNDGRNPANTCVRPCGPHTPGRLDPFDVARSLGATGGGNPMVPMVAEALGSDGLDADGWAGGVIDRALALTLARRLAGDVEQGVAASVAEAIVVQLA
jgi:hypothetical protein